MNFGEKLKLFREINGYNTVNSFAVFLGIPNSDLYKYEKNRVNPGRKFIERIKAKFPDFNEAYFFSEDAPMFKSQIQKPAESESNARIINIYERVAAGQPVALWDNPIDAIEISHPAINKRKNLFGFLVGGESMLPRFRNGDYVITQKLNLPEELPRNKDFIVTVFKDESEANLKLFKWLNKKEFLLIPLNTLYEPTMHSIKDIAYMFRVYLVISPVDYRKVQKNK